MKNFKLLLVALFLIPSLAFATPSTVAKRNDGAATTLQNTNLSDVPLAATNKGELWTIHAPATMHEIVGGASNNATSLKSTPGTVSSVQVFNVATAPRYLKFYNITGVPTPASSTVVKSILIPGVAGGAGAGAVITFNPPLNFSVGIGYAVVAGISNTDNTSIGASEVLINIDYK